MKNMPQGPIAPRRLVLGIDGTGSNEWPDIHQRRSFVKKLVNQIPCERKIYLLGHKDFADNTQTIVDVCQKTLLRADADGLNEVILVGYSRGAAGVTYMAHWLENYSPRIGLRVPAIILFDSVCRDPQMSLPFDIDCVPAICEKVFHARRDPRSYSRPYMSNASTKRMDNGRIRDLTRGAEWEYFYCSHSGLGGIPWDAEYFENFTADKIKLPATVEECYRISNDPIYAAKFGFESFLGVLRANQNLLGGVIFKESTQSCRVTLKEEEAGSSAVGEWMWKKLKASGFMGQFASPTKNAPAGSVVRTS